MTALAANVGCFRCSERTGEAALLLLAGCSGADGC
jgi:hypothetical protein